MASPYDPYKPPTASLEGARAPESGQAVPDAVVDLLVATRPWVKMFSVLTFVGLGLGVLGTSLALVFGRASLGPREYGVLVGTLLVLVLYVPPGIFLSRYAGGITRLQQGAGVPALKDAIANQKSFWKYVGILTVILIGVYILIIVGAVMVGVSMSR